ncbi:MAG: glycosyltransferase [Polyangiaceae bacterium]
MSPLGYVASFAVLAQVFSIWAIRFNRKNSLDASLEDVPDRLRGPGAPSVRVIVPARNEEANIAACAKAILASDYPNFTLRVVDDASTDRTGEILARLAKEDPRLVPVAGVPLPPGWLGKNNAVWQASKDATEDYLLFVDADLVVSVDAISKAVAVAERTRCGLFTMMPEIVALSFWELAAQVLVSRIILVGLGMREVNDPDHARAGAVGPFLLFARGAYRAIGGHEAVKGDAVEDMRLSMLVKEKRLGLVFARGVTLAKLRMYDSLGAIVRGWSKNFHVSLGNAFWVAPIAAVLLVLAYGSPWILVLVTLVVGDLTASAIAGTAFVLALLARLDLARLYRLPARQPWLEFPGSLVVGGILVRSAFRAARKLPFEWKGRDV